MSSEEYESEINAKPNMSTSEEREKFRSDISTMSFEDLLKLKEKIGSKLYNEKLYGPSARQPKTDFKRANKNRPRETSSKIRKIIKIDTKPVKKVVLPRDPRFDPMCGEFDNKTFKSNYKFLGEVKKNEKTQLLAELEKTEDPGRRRKIELLVQRIDNQLREEEKTQKENRKVFEERQEIKEKLKHGEKPVYKKKSEKRIENLVSQYEELKKNNKLQKHIEKKSKRLATKDRKNMETNFM